MKFIVNSSALLKQLSSINGVITTNPVLPILENFLFDIEGNTLRATASDMQTSMIVEIPIETKEKGKIAVPARKLLDTLKNLPDQPITITMNEDTYSLSLSSSNGNYKLAGENAADFPKVQPISTEHATLFPSPLLKRAVDYTLFATSADDLRPAMMGVYIRLTNNNATFAATDGHRLVRFRRYDVQAAPPGNETAIIVPRKALMLLRGALPSENLEVTMSYSASNAFFQFSNIRLICRLIDEKYPEYENVIPIQNPIKITIDRGAFLQSIRRVSIYANTTTYQIRLNIKGSALTIAAEDIEFSNEAKEELMCDHEGGDIEIGFNAKQLLELVSNFDADKIIINLAQPNKAGVLIPTEQAKDEDVLMLIMPVVLSQHDV